eukprot:TRINITY_DN2473_c0_g1_i1.p2 TRINITY_DN2473_c0_g1~~TRINITY_DN2473_c0_g1_i1.p2  ORF type:complete len:233 (+),score=63.63 TRINITY_DN2473_c0_g1_i1:883-1581(+)
MEKNEMATSITVLMPNTILATLHGRFLVANMQSTEGTLVVSIALGVIEVLLRLTQTQRDEFFYKWRYGREQAERMMHHPRSMRVSSDFIVLEEFVESLGILCSGAIAYLWKMATDSANPRAPTLETLVISVVIQYSTELVVDVLTPLMGVMSSMHTHVEGESDFWEPVWNRLARVKRWKLQVVASWDSKHSNYLVAIFFFAVIWTAYFMRTFGDILCSIPDTVDGGVILYTC